MDQSYEFTFAFTQDALSVSKYNLKPGSRCSPRTWPEQSPGPFGAPARLGGSPLMTARVLGAIYWQALWLWLKGARYHSHPVRVGSSPRRAMGEGMVGELESSGIPYPRWLTGVLKRAVLRKRNASSGALTLVDEQGTVHRFGDHGGAARNAYRSRSKLLWRAWPRRQRRRGESYFRAGDTDDLVALVRLMARNSDVLQSLTAALLGLGALPQRLPLAPRQYGRRKPRQYPGSLRSRQ